MANTIIGLVMFVLTIAQLINTIGHLYFETPRANCRRDRIWLAIMMAVQGIATGILVIAAVSILGIEP